MLLRLHLAYVEAQGISSRAWPHECKASTLPLNCPYLMYFIPAFTSISEFRIQTGIMSQIWLTYLNNRYKYHLYFNLYQINNFYVFFLYIRKVALPRTWYYLRLLMKVKTHKHLVFWCFFALYSFLFIYSVLVFGPQPLVLRAAYWFSI